MEGGRGGRLQQEQARWLKQFYIGDGERFDKILSVDKHAETKVFDAVIHVRTLSLMEGKRMTSFGTTEPTMLSANEAQTAARAFMSSGAFESMVRCFASNITAEILEQKPRRSLLENSLNGLFQFPRIGDKLRSNASNQSNSLPRRRLKGGKAGKKTLRIFLATDSADIRAEFARRLVERCLFLLNCPIEGPRYFTLSSSPLSFCIFMLISSCMMTLTPLSLA